MKIRLFVMFIIIIVLALMTLPGCKKENHITGTWFITTTLPGETLTDTYTFEGERNWGVILWEGQALGTYSVDGGNVSFTLEYLNVDGDFTVDAYNGFFDERDFMGGSFTHSVDVEGLSITSGTWFGER